MHTLLHLAVGAALLFGAALAQPRRLRIVNGCDREPMWIAHLAGAGIGPDPQDVKIEPLAYYDFLTSNGLSATRYWPKMGCDAAGNNCVIGDSGGPGEACVVRTPGGWDDYSNCAPPVDTKFEASFGVNGLPCNPAAPGGTEMAGCDYVDISLVDGFTLPVKLEIYGECKDSRDDSLVEQIDCTGLTLEKCPAAEVLAAAGTTTNLQAVNPHTRTVAGCYSPCQRLLDTKWINQAERRAEEPGVSPYCCPTPPVSPAACRAGPITRTSFLQTISKNCPGAYGYAYDDSNGLMRCSASTQYVLIYFCPAETPRLAAAGVPGNRTKAFLGAP